MSWQGYVDNNLVGSGHVSQAAIIGLNGVVFGISQGFQVSQSEATSLLEGFADNSKVLGSGLRFNGVKYSMLMASPSTA
ncbi:hypothetical protein [Absidia glauca]|uniref:Profilin n=1 Tax=Absidia glauca TaxID=4829 RepID=A0A168N2C5_ABSGL|nr:hypothetical protein [Absidia glauca]